MTDIIFNPINLSCFSAMRRNLEVPSKEGGTRTSLEGPNKKMDKFIFRVKLIVLISIVIALISLGANAYTLFASDKVYAPLGPYKEQEVTSRVQGIPGPAVVVGDRLDVTGKKCSKEDTAVTGSVTWVMESPKRVIVPAGTGQEPRGAGCETFNFENPMPDEVVEEVEEQARQGFPYTQWVVSGTETPIDKKGARGQPIVWTTEKFQIISNQR